MSQPTPRRPSSVRKTIKFPRLDRDETTGVEIVTTRELTVVFDFSAIAALEDLYDMPLKDIGERFKDTTSLRIRDVQRMIFAGLRTHHPEITFDATLVLLNEAVGAGVSVGEVMTDTFSAFDAGAGHDGKPDADPQTAG